MQPPPDPRCYCRSLVKKSPPLIFFNHQSAIHSVPEPQDPPPGCKLQDSVRLSLSVPPLLPLSLSHSAAAPSAPQSSRSTALSHIYTHTLFFLHAHTHIYTHTHAHKHCLLRYPIRRSGFSSGIPSASSPGNGRCSSRVSERSERCRRVPLIGDAAGSLLLFLLHVQESASYYTSNGDLKWTSRLIRI